MGLNGNLLLVPSVSHSTPPHVSIDRNPPDKTLHISATRQCLRSIVEVATIDTMSPAIALAILPTLCAVSMREIQEKVTSMTSKAWHSLPSSELLLISAGSGLMAWCSPRYDCLAVVAIVLLARFRGRASSAVAASAFSLIELACVLSGGRFSEGHAGLRQAITALCAVWLCRAFIPGTKTPEELSAESGTLFDVPLDKLSKYVWSRKADGSLEYVSPASCEYLGVSVEGMQDFSHFIHPEDVEVRRSAMAKAAVTGEPQQLRARYRSATGEYQWFATLLHSQRDSHNSVTRYFGLQWNIDEDTRREEEMRARNNIWEIVLKIFPGWIWVAGPDGTPELISPRGLEYTGLAGEELIANPYTMVHPDDKQIRADHWKRLLETEQPGEIEVRFRRADGMYRWFTSRAHPLRDQNGKIQRWVNINWDIDERKRAEEERKDKDLLFRRIADGLPACICIMAPDGTMVYANTVASMALGKPTDQILGDQWTQHIHPEQYDEGYKTWMHCVATRTPLDTRWLMLQYDGQYRWQHILADPSFDEHGNVVSWYMMGIEIDQQVRAEQERQCAEDHLRETRAKLNTASRIATVAELSASIAHELNQPLMSVLANAQAGKRWLATTPPNLEETAASVDRIVRDCRAADETMQRIRALFRRESFEKKEASVPEMISEAIRLIQEDPNKRKLPIECTFEKNLPKIAVDPIQIQAVFINLFSNAIEAMENNVREPELAVRASILDSNEMVIEVIDNGPGVDDPENIFDAFVTTKDMGMGIGLAVSRSIVEAHGGQLWAENNLTSGARFTLILPLPNSTRSSPRTQVVRL